jgi:two-component system, cell cycle response regulator CpdR
MDGMSQLAPVNDPPRVLVVDDEAGVRSLVSMVLKQAGYAVRQAQNADEAMAAFETEAIDLLLSDVRMPGMNGHALAQWVATKHPATRTALMTGYDAECPGCPYAPRCRIMQKPFRPADLISFVKMVIAEPADFVDLRSVTCQASNRQS